MTTIVAGRNQEPAFTIALLNWSAVLEDFLEPLGVSLEDFCRAFTGSWLFGYAAALETAGVRSVIICTSKGVEEPTSFTHGPTGARIWILPRPRVYGAVHRRMVYAYGQTVREAFGEIRGRRRLLLPFYAIVRELALYLATPLSSLAQVLRREGCRAILCQEYEYPRFDMCVLLGKAMRLPVFACFQGGNYQHSHLERALRPIAMRLCAGLIVGAASEARRVRERYGVPTRKLARIFNPIDSDVWRPVDRREARTALAIPPNAEVVVWHGRVALHKKGLDVLLDAWKRTCRVRPDRDLRLLLIGTGDDAEELRRRLASFRSNQVSWLDVFLHDRELVRRHLSAADVYAFASRYEGFPVAPLEAMACGLPLVATNVEGIRDILADGEASGGLVVPGDDAVALASEIGHLLDQPEWRRELGSRARRTIETRFSLEATGEKLRVFLATAATAPTSPEPPPAGTGVPPR